MRFIDWQNAEIPDSWMNSADTALKKLREYKTIEERKKYINQRRLWADTRIKTVMERISDGKCWYCETKDIRSDNPIDHFRPKGKVTECEDHDGYWWLAFDWKNFRYACSFCNTGHKDDEAEDTLGKDNYFPLLDEEKRAMSESSSYTCDDEKPMLLDPTVEADTRLLWFDDDGRVAPRSTRDPIAVQRVEKSRDVYHLDDPRTKDARRQIYNKIKRKVELGKRLAANLTSGHETQTSAEVLEDLIIDLQEMTLPSAPFASVANAYLLGFYDEDAEWILKVWETGEVEDEEPEEVQSE